MNIVEVLSIVGDELTVFITAMIPVIELRGAIPLGISLGMMPARVVVLSFIGSIIPAPFILFGIKPVFSCLMKLKVFKPLVDKLTETSLNKNSEKIEKYGVWGLVLIVAIPLPGTGVWSGSLIAALLNIRFRWALPAIIVGNAIAAVAIVGLSSGFLQFIN